MITFPIRPAIAGIALLGCAFGLAACDDHTGSNSTSGSSSGPGTSSPAVTVTKTEAAKPAQPPADSAEHLLHGATSYNIGSANDLSEMKWAPTGESGTALWEAGDCQPSCAAGHTTTKKVKFQFENGDKNITLTSLSGKQLGVWTTKFPGD